MLPSGFENSIELRLGHFYLILAPRRIGRSLMNALAARLSLAGPVLVLDGGNAFDAHGIARQVRRQTVEMPAALGRLRVSRAFTCHQMVAMLGASLACKPVPGQQPVLALDLLATFLDENENLRERTRLLGQAIGYLKRLSAAAALAVSVTSSPTPEVEPPSGWPLGMPGILAAPPPVMMAMLEAPRRPAG